MSLTIEAGIRLFPLLVRSTLYFLLMCNLFSLSNVSMVSEGKAVSEVKV
jgi:hypothetical protein